MKRGIMVIIVIIAFFLLIGITSAVIKLGGGSSPEGHLTASQNVPPTANVGENVMVTVMLTYSGSNATVASITPGLPSGLETNFPGGQTELHPGISAPISYRIRAVQSGTYLVISQVSYSEKGTRRNLRLESPFTAIELTHSEKEPNAIIEKIKPTVVSVFAYLENGTYSQGSGFFLDLDGDVITCLHVVKNSSRIEIKAIDGQIYQVKKIVAEDADADLARLSVEIPQGAVHVLPIDYELPNQGDDIYVMGSPEGLEYSLTKGIISAIRDNSTIQITASISPGSSGSPVVNMDGEAIGIVRSHYEEGQNLNLATASERVLQLILPSFLHIRSLV